MHFFLEFSSLHFVFKYSLAAVYLLQAAEMRVNLGKTPLWPVYHCRKERETYLFNINLVNNMFYVVSDMEFVKNFTHPDFQAKSFTPQKCVICDSFFRELTA